MAELDDYSVSNSINKNNENKQQSRIMSNSEFAKRRASPRLSEIPEAKRPFYGPRPQSPPPPPPPRNYKAKKDREEIRTDTITTPIAFNSGVAKKRYNSRLTEIPASKRPKPNYGPNSKSSTPIQDSSPTSTTNKTKTRRSSSRIPEAKRPYYGPKPQSPRPFPKENDKEASSDGDVSTITTSQLQRQSSGVNSIGTRFEYVPHSADDIAKVKATLRVYNKHYLHFVQDESARDSVFVKRHKKKTGLEKKQVKRPDLIATTEMRNSNEILFPKKRLGHLPGIDIGCNFYSRAEMVAVGIHSHWLYGIDYMGKEYSKMDEYKGYKFPLAVAIVCSGEYEDDEDNREVIEYTGQGGNDFHGTKHQIKNQEMSPGNLSLMNCMEQSIPVRFIRGTPGDKRFNGDTHSKSKLYTYYGLYKVESYQLDAGKSGFAVYKFRLKRLEGQPKLTGNKVQYNKYNQRRISTPSVPKLVSLDITGGQENLPIPVINAIDDTVITGFTYTKSIQLPSGMKLPQNAAGCKCKGNCTNSKTCACAKLNGGEFPYAQDRLIEAKDVVFECGPNCGCGPGCSNRISQREIKYQLEIFRTSNRGWAVKTKDFIPSGAPICEYIGQLRRQRDMDKVDNNEYIFEIDCEQTIKEIDGRERRLGTGSGKSKNASADEKESIPSEPEFCIEAGSVGNVARFINHSCDPNLFVQCIVSSHHELKLARIVLVAADNIPPNEELTYDYGYVLDSVVDEDGNVQKLTCHCGTSLCRGRLY